MNGGNRARIGCDVSPWGVAALTPVHTQEIAIMLASNPNMRYNISILIKKVVDKMTMAEASRVILGLRAAGWNERDINDFILWIETGDIKYMPKAANA